MGGVIPAHFQEQRRLAVTEIKSIITLPTV
jgi:hypothetical protein